jgi:LysR family transcriptional regulator, benzoate and cis,cis-muconate-responsive activator of ben and cat genes
LLRKRKAFRGTAFGPPPLLSLTRPLQLEDLAGESLVVYPRAPRPSYADQVLSLFSERHVKPDAIFVVREWQTALGLVAAEAGVCLVPVSVESLQRENVVYRPLDEVKAVSPIILSTRMGDRSPEIALLLRLIRDIYRKARIDVGT